MTLRVGRLRRVVLKLRTAVDVARRRSPMWSARWFLPLVAPLIVALPPLFWVIDGMRRVTLVTLGRDQGIFQYVAWAVLHGDKDYLDVRDVNGPLIHLIHIVFQLLGGTDEHRFRVLDLAASSLSFAIVGACLPGLGALARKPATLPRAPSWPSRLGWALAAWAVLGGQYLLYLYWDLAQRESFCDWFILVAVGVQLVAQSPFRARGRRVERVRLAAIGLSERVRLAAIGLSERVRLAAIGLSERVRLAAIAFSGGLGVLTWFGKPTYVLFTGVQLVTLLWDRDLPITIKKRFVAFAIGGALFASTQLVYLLVFADIGTYLRIALHDVPTMYRFIWPKSAAEIFAQNGNTVVAASAIVSSLVFLALIIERQMPRRALAIALFPLVGLANVLLQRKGFPYHFHPVTAGYHLQWLAFVAWLWERFGRPSRTLRVVRLVPLVASAALAFRVTADLQMSPHIQNVWILEKGETPELRETHDFLVYFRDRDYFPFEMRQAAAFLRANTKPTDTVQQYGMDPYVLFLAGRKSATPYIYAYDLNADAALNGGYSLYPNEEASWRIRLIRDANEADMLARLERAQPAAFVFVDKAPLISSEDARADFGEHCPKASAWFASRYEKRAEFGEFRIFMRRDLESVEPGVGSHPPPP